MIGIVVDGQSDFLAFRRKYLGVAKVSMVTRGRGGDTTIRSIVGSSLRHIDFLAGFGCSKVIVVCDFEDRTDDYLRFRRDLLDEFLKQRPNHNIQVSLPNRMLENWVLADLDSIQKKNYIRKNRRIKGVEGCNGKKILKTLFKKGTSYKETKHLPELFGIISDDIGSQNSPSFAHFIQCMRA